MGEILEPLRFVYVGRLPLGTTCEQRLRAILSLGHHVAPLDTSLDSLAARHLLRLLRPLAPDLDVSDLHGRLLARIAEERPQILWIDKTLTLGRRTLEAARSLSPDTFQISYSPDDMLNPSNQTPSYLEAISSYDLHVTTKAFNVAELKELGAREVLFVNNAFCPWTHCPRELSEGERSRYGGPVGFLGFPEAERRRSIEYLASHGVEVRVWGPWRRSMRPNLRIEGRSLWGDAYTTAVCAFDIVLGFLRRENRDVQTQRSMEIPACGAFLLAERSLDHQALFREGEEAEFFASDEELLEKARYYLAHPEQRARIAARGRQRCLESGYDNPGMIEKVLCCYSSLRRPAGRQALRILYAGPLAPGGTCFQRLADLRTMGHSVTAMDLRAWRFDGEGWGRLAKSALRVLGFCRRSAINRDLMMLAANLKPDVVWIDKGLNIRRSTLLDIHAVSSHTRLVHYSPDDMINPDNQSADYLEGLDVYDLHVTTKSYNVAELKSLGAQNVVFVDKSYCPRVHQPVFVTAEERARLGGPVGFTGYPEAARQRSIEYLAAHGIPVRVWGPWRRRTAKFLRVEGRSLWSHEYAAALCSFDINLCFLRKENRDLQTSRSVEIPACGAFMLGERTVEHLRLFREGEEAEFFSSDEEMLEKVRYYLVHGEERARIAAAGRRRCLASGYRNVDRIATVLEACDQLSGAGAQAAGCRVGPWK